VSNAENLARIALALSADASLNLTANNAPAQFDTSKAVVTMDALQRALGNMAGNATINGPTGSLSAADAGKRLVCLATTLTLPAASSVPSGATFHVSFSAGSNTTINVSGGDTIYSGETLSAASSATATNGCYGTLVRTVANTWLLIGSAALQYEQQFGRTIAQNGFQRLPGGLIIQWGITAKNTVTSPLAISYPATFPNNVFACIASIAGAANPNGGAVSTQMSSTSAFNAYTTSGYSGCAIAWIAIGN
jgi:hypothetical protein